MKRSCLMVSVLFIEVLGQSVLPAKDCPLTRGGWGAVKVGVVTALVHLSHWCRSKVS